ncbi:MAG: hypothetical protein N0A00_09770 [Candidatus Bathyarchaeota archaeon]|nr:hypothetical protein [Candidatus Bathyarchaeota archaeon]
MKSTKSSVKSLLMICIASKVLCRGLSYGMPKGTRFMALPTPMPRIARPLDRTSQVAAI